MNNLCQGVNESMFVSSTSKHTYNQGLDTGCPNIDKHVN